MSSVVSLLEPYKYVLWLWYIFEDQTLEETHNLLHIYYPEVELLPQNGPLASGYPSARTLSRTFHEWSYSKRELAVRSPKLQQELQERLWTLFYNLALSDEEIMLFLDAEGFGISLRS